MQRGRIVLADNLAVVTEMADQSVDLIYVDPLNPEYHPLPGVQLILDRGATARYDAYLHRLGRVILSVMSPNCVWTWSIRS